MGQKKSRPVWKKISAGRAGGPGRFEKNSQPVGPACCGPADYFPNGFFLNMRYHLVCKLCMSYCAVDCVTQWVACCGWVVTCDLGVVTICECLDFIYAITYTTINFIPLPSKTKNEMGHILFFTWQLIGWSLVEYATNLICGLINQRKTKNETRKIYKKNRWRRRIRTSGTSELVKLDFYWKVIEYWLNIEIVWCSSNLLYPWLVNNYCCLFTFVCCGLVAFANFALLQKEFQSLRNNF